MRLRAANRSDIPQLHRIRLSVRENQLGERSGIADSSYIPYLKPDCAWLAEVDGAVAGFAILDPESRSVWALFVDPRFEGYGIGRALHDRLVDSARKQGLERLFLNTGESTRAEHFYRRHGWDAVGTEDGELRFERRV